MFEQNDQAYNVSKIIVKVCWITLCAIAGLSFMPFMVLSIMSARISTTISGIYIGIGFGCLITFLLISALVYVVGNLMLSKSYDIKVIRDKICNVPNSRFYCNTPKQGFYNASQYPPH